MDFGPKKWILTPKNGFWREKTDLSEFGVGQPGRKKLFFHLSPLPPDEKLIFLRAPIFFVYTAERGLIARRHMQPRGTRVARYREGARYRVAA